jgi:hypothetical protein
MKRKLMRSENGWGVFLSKTILELLNVDPENNMVELEIEKDVLRIKRAQKNETN